MLGTTTLAAGAIATGWYAWETGLVPGNPRAPTVRAMEPVVHRALYPTLVAQGLACVGPRSQQRPDVQGRNGIAPRDYPGQHAVIFLNPADDPRGAARAPAIEQFAYLAKEGFYDDADVALETQGGPRAGRRFQLTWHGFANAVDPGHANCFYVGTRQFDGVKQIERLPDMAFEMDAYQVSYETSVHGLQPWAATAYAKELFPSLAQVASTRREAIRLMRGRSGWLTETEVAWQLQLARIQADGRVSGAVVNQIKQLLEQPPVLDESATSAALDSYLTSDAWRGRGSLACLPLRLQRGGDERLAPQDRHGFVATWYDAPPGVRRDYEQRAMLTQLHMLAALEAAGLASMERVEGGTVNKAAVRGGVRFTLNAKGLALLGASGSGCLPAGRLDVELLGVNPVTPSEARLAMRGRVSGTPDWVAMLARSLPALQSMLEDGLPMVGRLAYLGDSTAMRGIAQSTGQWQVVDLSPAYPQVVAAELAPVLQPLLPETARAAATRVRALSATGPSSALGGISAASDADAGARRASASSGRVVGPVPPPRDARKTAPGAGGARTPPYPAGDADVHFVSVYQGALPRGAVRGSANASEGVVNVVIGKTANPVLLLAIAYEPVEWRIAVESGARLARVVAIGMHEPRVTILGAQDVETVVRRVDVLSSAGLDEESNWFLYETRGNAALEGESIARAVTGKPPATFQARYTGEGVFTVNAATRPWAPPARQSADTPSAEAVVLRSHFAQAVDGLTLTYGGAGAFTEAWSSRVLSSGKAYFEGTLSVAGGGYASSHANIGIGSATPEGALALGVPASSVPLIPSGHQRLYRDGDVFGVAVDFDAGLAYFRVNGGWVTGEPGSGKGERLVTGRTYVAYFFATGGGRSGQVGWRANFGGSAFRHPPPKGYVSWDGARRG